MRRGPRHIFVIEDSGVGAHAPANEAAIVARTHESAMQLFCLEVSPSFPHPKNKEPQNHKPRGSFNQ